MPEFKDASDVEALAYGLRLADHPRGRNRALINDLANGVPPYTADEVKENGINVNVNSLELTTKAHEGRSQFYSAFMRPGKYFSARTDMGSVHKRAKYSSIVTHEIAKVMKRSLKFFECSRSEFALDVLHGIGPSTFKDQDAWCTDPIGIEDVLLPGNTMLSDLPSNNVPYFFIYRSMKAPELIRLTRGPKNSGWNMPLVNRCLEWLDQECQQLMNSNWPTMWTPEKSSERIKSDGGCYASDAVPTIDMFDFYYWHEGKGKAPGWCRKIILDSWGAPQLTGTGYSMSDNSKMKWAKKEFLYDSGGRKYASKMNEIVNFQFADLSAVAPFRYHSVRSLGFLLYSVCHLQNRMRCKFSESVFEALMMYFRANSEEDFQRALKVNLHTKGFIEKGIEFVPASDRFQVNAGLVELGLNENAKIIASNSTSYTAKPNMAPDKRDITATQFMGETQAATQLVSTGLLQCYQYQAYKYTEMFRRFLRPNSRDVEVRAFRAACIRQRVPEEVLVPEAWEIEPERTMGAGNKTLELAITERLMSYRNLYDPEPQRQILRDVTMALTDDPARAEALVPEQPHISDSIHDAQLAAGSLMAGLPVAIKTGINHSEYVEALIADMAVVIGRIEQNGGMATQDQIMGLQNMAQHIGQHIGIIAQDKSEGERVKQYGDQMGKLMNLVKAYQQRLHEQMQKAQQANGQNGDPETAGKIEAMKITAEAKAANTRESHAERTAQRRIQFEMETENKQQANELDLRNKAQEAALKINTEAASAEIELEKQRRKPVGGGSEE